MRAPSSGRHSRERVRFFEKDALLLKKHPDRYRTLFLKEAHYLNTEGFHEHFRRGAVKYGVQIDEFLAGVSAAGSTVMDRPPQDHIDVLLNGFRDAAGVVPAGRSR